jgi:hypothetical protein
MLCFDLLSRRLLRGGTKSLTYFSSTPPYAGRAIPVDTRSTLYQSSRRQQRRLQFKPNSHLATISIKHHAVFRLTFGETSSGWYKGLNLFFLHATIRRTGYTCTLEGNRTLLQQNNLSLNDNVKLTPPSTKTTTVEPLITDTAGEFKFCPL